MSTMLNGQAVASISASDSHVCGLTSDGVVLCQATDPLNNAADLGPMGGANAMTAVVRTAGPVAFTAISAGATHTCALGTDGHAYCWGTNIAGELGDGTTATRSLPSEVLGSAP